MLDITESTLDAIKLRQGDVVVFTPGASWTASSARAMLKRLRAVFPDHAVIVLQHGDELRVVSPVKGGANG